MTTNKKYSLVWQKWADPFGDDDDLNTPRDTPPEDIGDFDDDMGILNKELQQEELIPSMRKPTKAIMTPLGLIPYNEHTASGRIFNFWTGHTNFNLSLPVVSIIESTEGVETLDVFTRYRFRIAIGQLFEPAMVMSNITCDVYEYLQQQE